MKSVLAVFGIVAVLGGTFFGIVNWVLVEFYLPTVDWDGPIITVNQVAWLLNILGLGIGAALIGVATMLKSPGTK